MYDPAEDSWTAIASMMVPRCEFGLCAVDGRLYAFGGWVGEDIGQPVYSDPGSIGVGDSGSRQAKMT